MAAWDLARAGLAGYRTPTCTALHMPRRLVASTALPIRWIYPLPPAVCGSIPLMGLAGLLSFRGAFRNAPGLRTSIEKAGQSWSNSVQTPRLTAPDSVPRWWDAPIDTRLTFVLLRLACFCACVGYMFLRVCRLHVLRAVLRASVRALCRRSRLWVRYC